MRSVVLGDIAEIVSGATPKSGVPEYWGGDVLWATPADLSKLEGAYIANTPRTLTEAGIASCAATVLPPGSVLLSSRAPIGHVAINTRPMATNQGFKSLVLSSDEVDAKYVYHWLRWKASYLQSLGNGATFKEISKSTVSRVEIPLPRIERQRRTSAILDQVDDVQAKRRRTLAHLDALAQSVLFDMFEFSRLETRSVADICDRITVGVVIRPASYYVETGVPALRTLNVKPGRIDLSNLVFFSHESNDGPLAKSRLRGGDLVVARTGKAGVAAVVPSELDGANAIDLIVVSPDQRSANPIFLESLLNSAFGKRIVGGQTRGQIQQHFNVGSLKEAMIPVPPIDCQREFASRVRLIESNRAAVLRALATGEELLSTLQARAFRGDL